MNQHAPLQPLIGVGHVRHTRLRPAHHAFAYGTFFVLLPMRTLAQHGDAALAINRAGVAQAGTTLAGEVRIGGAAANADIDATGRQAKSAPTARARRFNVVMAERRIASPE